MIWLAANISSGPDLVTLLGGIGIGAIVGAAVTGIFSALNGKWQRDHDREMRGRDYGQQALALEAAHRHELALRQLEDKQRLRDRRIAILQDGLTEMVEGLVGLTEAVSWMRFKGVHKEEANAAKAEAAKHFDLARPRLVLDPAGREVMETFRSIQLAMIEWEGTEDSREWFKLDREIVKMLSDAVERSQQIMEQAAQPVTT